MPRLTVLGCAPGSPAADRNSSAYLLETDSGTYLLDCGEGVSRSILQLGKNPLSIGTILLSHTHPDHIAGLPLFLQMVYLLGRKDKLSIFLPEEARLGIRQYLDLCYLFEEKLPFGIQLIPIEKNWKKEFADFTISAFANRHLSGYREVLPSPRYFNQMQSFSFLFDFEVARFYYSGDLFDLEDLKNLPDGVELLLVEGLHLPIEPLLAFCTERSVKKVVLTHLAQKDFDAKEKWEAFGQKLGLDCRVAFDGMAVTF